MNDPDKASEAAAARRTDPLGRLRHAVRNLDRLSALAAGLLVLGLAGLGWYVAAEHRQRARVALGTAHIVAAERLLSALKDIETGERGYVITGNDAYLDPYRTGLTQLDPLLGILAGGGPDADALPRAVAARRDLAVRIVETRRGGGSAAADTAVITGDDKAAMDRCRTLVAAVEERAGETIRRAEAVEAWRGPLLLTVATAATLAGFCLIALVATRRRRAEHASRTMLAGVLDNAPIGLGFLDGALRVRHMNRAMAAMSERALGADVGDSIWDTMPELRPELEPRLRQVVDASRVIRDVEVSAESLRQAGQVRTFLFSFFPLPSSRRLGSDGAGLVVTDVTVRQRNERRLRESEERFRSLIEASAAIIWVTPANGRFEQPQPTWTSFTGQNFSGMQGLGWLDAVHPDDREDTAVLWQEALGRQSTFSTEHRLRRADGTWRIMAARAIPILEPDGAVREWIGAHTDITERRLAEAELVAAKDAAEAANRAKSQFLANMSHELRTPLSAVIGYSEMLEEEFEDLGHTELLPDLRKINSNARHLLGLINDVLDLSKIEADRMTSYAEDFDAETLLRDVAGTVEALVLKKGNRLVLDLGDPPALGPMHTDQVKLRQCLFNLISNAAKFTENGTITLRARREGEMLMLSVTDTGIGMSPEQVARLFERFTQADASTTRRFGGTGLGLAITRAFCRLLGGDVAVTSAEGQGSTFTMRVAVVLPEADSGETPATDLPARTEPGSDRHLVLVVDDDANQRDLLDRFLEREGFAVRTAADGATGLELARTLQPRAILLDVMMPQMDGWSVLTALKSDATTAGIPVILITFINEPSLGLSLGASDLLPKPVDWERLRQVLDRFRGEGGVLVVDDDVDARLRLRTLLERNNWTVTEAANGREALAEVERAVPQLILLDLTMPVMDGFSFLHELRERPDCRDIPVVVLTARDLSAAERRRLDSADRVLSKGQTTLRAIAGEVSALAKAPAAGEPA